jgi:hypothetical protein
MIIILSDQYRLLLPAPLPMRLWLNTEWVTFRAISEPTASDMIQINQPTRCHSFTSLFLDVYVWLDMFREYPRLSSGAYNCTSSLWFYRWKEAAGSLLVVICQTTTSNDPAACL